MKHVNKYADAIDDAWRIYVPADHIESVLSDNHVNKLAAHGGFAKTLYRIRRQYYWPLMQQDIAHFIKRCDVCKPTNLCQTTPMGYYRDPERPFKMISIDFCGPYTRTRAKHCKALRTATANATIDFLEHEVFLKYGVPSVLISDNGPQLRAAIFAEFLARHGVKHWKTPLTHAQANATEAANKTVINAVRAYMREDNTQNYFDTCQKSDAL